MDRARGTLWINFIIDYSLPLQMKLFGPKKFQFSCMGKKVPIWQFFRIFKNCQNGTFLPMHENQKKFWPNAFIWSAKKVPFSNFIQNMSQTKSKCLSKWIKWINEIITKSPRRIRNGQFFVIQIHIQTVFNVFPYYYHFP